jgi:hypothetical protein
MPRRPQSTPDFSTVNDSPLIGASCPTAAPSATHAGNHAVDLGGRDSDPWLLGLLSVLVAVALVRRVRQLHYVDGRVDRSSDPRLAPFVEQKPALLTTFRRDGTPSPRR